MTIWKQACGEHVCQTTVSNKQRYTEITTKTKLTLSLHCSTR